MSKSIYSTMSMYDLHLIEKTILEKGDIESVLKVIMKYHGHDENNDVIMFYNLDMMDIGLNINMISEELKKRVEVVDRYGFCSMIVSK